MATEDKAAHKATELKGKAKEAVGDVTDDQDLQAEGQADQAEGNVKQAGDKVIQGRRNGGLTSHRR